MKKLSIIIPVYNESAHIEEVINKIQAVKLPAEIAKELILVDDGSSDGTTEKLKQYRDNSTMIVHSSRINFGKGTAIRVGLTYATGDYILIQDGDLEYDPQDYLKLLEPVLNNGAKVVYGSRFMNAKGKIKGMHWANWLANMLLRLQTNVLYGANLTDEATAYKLFSRNVFEGVSLRSKRFEFCPEVTAKVLKAGYKIFEVPISYNPRSLIEGKKITWRDGVEAFWTLFKYRFVD